MQQAAGPLISVRNISMDSSDVLRFTNLKLSVLLYDYQ